MTAAYRIVVWHAERDAPIVDEIREAYGALARLVEPVAVEHVEAVPAREAEQEGTYILVVSSALMRPWFARSPWTRSFLDWREAGGRALAVVPDSTETAGGPLVALPQLHLGGCEAMTRSALLAEFVDVPRQPEIVLDARASQSGALAHGRGAMAWFDGRREEARAAFDDAVRTREALTAGDPRLAASLNALAAAEASLGDLEPARDHVARALALRASWLGKASPQTAVSENNLGAVSLLMGNAADAARLCGAAAETLFPLGGVWQQRSGLAALHAAVACERLGDPTGARRWHAHAKRCAAVPLAAPLGLLIN